MKVKILLVVLSFISINAYSQVSLSGISGTESLIGLRAGYKINDHLELGAKYNPALNLLSSMVSAGFIGGYAKYNFEELTGMLNSTFVPYIIVSVGQITPPNSSYKNITSSGAITTSSINYKSILGGAIGGGVEFGTNKLRYFPEIGFGQIPNILKSINSTDPYSSTVQSADTKKAFTAPYYISFGMVYYF